MALTAVLIVLLTAAADRFGAIAAGILSALPTLASVLAVFTHRRDGRDALLALLRGMVGGIVAFAAFCAIVGGLVDRVGVGDRLRARHRGGGGDPGRGDPAPARPRPTGSWW